MSSKHAPGTIVWAKIKGYPWWPAKIKKEDEVPSSVLKQKPNRPAPIVSVKFFGTKDYGWISSENIKSFDEHFQEFNKGRRGVQFDRAVKEASNPDAQVTDSEEEMHEVEEEEEEEEVVSEEEETVKKTPKRGGRKKAEPRRKSRGKADSDDASDSEPEKEKKVKKTPSRRASSGRRSSRNKPAEEEEEEEDEYEESINTRKRKSLPVEEPTSKRRRSSRKDKSAEKLAESKEEEPESSTPQRVKQKPKPRSPSEKLMYLRHKLQKLTMKDVIGDMNVIDSLMKEVEEFDMNLSLLRETKIGKLMKRISQLNVEEDPFDIKDRAYTLTKKWRSLLIEDVLSDKQQANEDESERPDDDGDVDPDAVPMDVDQEEAKGKDSTLNENIDSGSEAETEIENQSSPSGSKENQAIENHVSHKEENNAEPKLKDVPEHGTADTVAKEADNKQPTSEEIPGVPSQLTVSTNKEPSSKTEGADADKVMPIEEKADTLSDDVGPSIDNKNQGNVKIGQIGGETSECDTQMKVETTPAPPYLKDESKPFENIESLDTEVQDPRSLIELQTDDKPDMVNGEPQSEASTTNETISQEDKPGAKEYISKGLSEEVLPEQFVSTYPKDKEVTAKSTEDEHKSENENQVSAEAATESSEAQTEQPSESLKARSLELEETELKEGEGKAD